MRCVCDVRREADSRMRSTVGACCAALALLQQPLSPRAHSSLVRRCLTLCATAVAAAFRCVLCALPLPARSLPLLVVNIFEARGRQGRELIFASTFKPLPNESRMNATACIVFRLFPRPPFIQSL